MDPFVDVHDMTIRYGSFVAVNKVSFTVESGQVLGVVGGNGAGKSSTLRAIAGVNPPTSGRLHIRGRDLGNVDAAAQAHKVTGYCPDVGGLIPRATVREHLALSLTFRDHTHLWPDALTMVDEFGLGAVLDRPTSGFSHGMCRRLSVLLASLASREVLILDEPFDGVDPIGVEVALGVVSRASAAGVAVIVSTHLLNLLTACVDDVVVMVDGQVADRGSVDSYKGDEGVVRYTNLLRGLTP